MWYWQRNGTKESSSWVTMLTRLRAWQCPFRVPVSTALVLWECRSRLRTGVIQPLLQLGREDAQLPVADVTNGWSSISTLPTHLHDVHKDTFTYLSQRGPLVSSCERRNMCSGYINGRGFPDQLIGYQFLKMHLSYTGCTFCAYGERTRDRLCCLKWNVTYSLRTPRQS
jgi:hypothetical protein